MLEEKRFRNGTDAARSEQPDQGGDEMDEKKTTRLRIAEMRKQNEESQASMRELAIREPQPFMGSKEGLLAREKCRVTDHHFGIQVQK